MGLDGAMNMTLNNQRFCLFSLSLTLGLAFLAGTSGARAQGLAPLNIVLPSASQNGTPTNDKPDPNIDSNTNRPPFMAPAGVTNVALHKKVTSSATNTTPEDLGKITDGEKEGTEDNVVLLLRGSQWVQIDLGSPQEIYAIVVWHAYNSPKVYHGVIAQLADGPDFTATQNVRTIFNNDVENKAGLGIGTNREYIETREGKLIDAKGAKARYVRLYSNGSTSAKFNEYTEAEVYGRPAK
jgi:hypothetical protein